MTAKKFLITGGAGFIGSNFARRLIARGENVTIFDNLSRIGADRNISRLAEEFGKMSFQFIKADIRDVEAVKKAAREKDVIVHLAAQVAVTSSVEEPRSDFEINAGGTFNVLEGARQAGNQPVVIYASTNKVYGGLEDLKISEGETRYHIDDLPLGINENRGLDFHSPYGCSKGSGDQYTRDYFRIYQIPTVVFRQSCIYGVHQYGVEDQGWVAWFLIALKKKKPLTIYGDGKQVRDLLYIDDLMDIYDLAIEKIDIAAGEVYNIGGGAAFSLSVWYEFSGILAELFGEEIRVKFGDWRPGDQKVYISDIRKFMNHMNWKPRTAIAEGTRKLFDWITENEAYFV